MPTLTTLPFLVLVFLLWRWTRGNLLAVVAFTCIFDAASVLNIGTLCVSPWLMALIVCLPSAVSRNGLRGRVYPTANKTAMYLLLAFICFAAFSGLVYPLLFTGVPVVHGIEVVPLEWGLPNVAQLCYLAAAAVIFLISISSTPDEISQAVTWYVRGCIAASIIAIYQLANAVLHVPFPEAILYSNTAHIVYHAYQIKGMWRLNSTFTEASDMAGSLIGALGMVAWDLVHRHMTLGRIAAFSLMLIAILMTLSTTGYLCLALAALIAVVSLSRRVSLLRGIEARKALLILLTLSLAATTFIASDSSRLSASKLISSVILEKQDSLSFRAREQSHQQALAALRETSYLGAGWGSTRASGLAYTLLASTGIAGLLLFTLSYLALFIPFLTQRGGWQPPNHGVRIMVGLSLLLFSMVLSGSEPIQPMLWIFLGAAIVCNPTSRRSPASSLQPGRGNSGRPQSTGRLGPQDLHEAWPVRVRTPFSTSMDFRQ